MDEKLLRPLRETVDAIAKAIVGVRGRGFSGIRETQYHLDVAADNAALAILVPAGFQVVSEESGVTGSGDYTVVIDPIDGSTNCDRGVPFFATSLAVVHRGELIAGVVSNQATGTLYEAVRGGGASRDGVAIHPSGEKDVANALVSFSGWPSRNLGWAQMRALGAAALEICLVADGSLDAFAVAQHSTLNPWDYLAGMLIGREAGAFIADYRGEELVTADRIVRRPVIAGSEELLTTFLEADTL